MCNLRKKILYKKHLCTFFVAIKSTSLFRAILRYFKTTLLRREYRFNQDILYLINPYYEYKLIADQSVSNISTADIAKKNYDGTNNNLKKILQHDKKVVFVDTVIKEERINIL